MNFETLVGTTKGTIFHIEYTETNVILVVYLGMPCHHNYSRIFKKPLNLFLICPDIRVMVLTGRGKHLCVGLDLKEAPQMFQVHILIILVSRGIGSGKKIHSYLWFGQWQAEINDCPIKIDSPMLELRDSVLVEALI